MAEVEEKNTHEVVNDSLKRCNCAQCAEATTYRLSFGSEYLNQLEKYCYLLVELSKAYPVRMYGPVRLPTKILQFQIDNHDILKKHYKRVIHYAGTLSCLELLIKHKPSTVFLIITQV